MSALRTPTLPRRDTLRAHPQPRAALLRQAEGGVTFIIQSQPVSSAPLTSWGTAAHTDGFQADGTHSNSHTSVTHVSQTQTEQATDGFCSHHKHSRGQRLCSAVAKQPREQSNMQLLHSNIRINQSFIHSYIHHKHSFITFEHSNQSLITIMQSFIIQSGTTGGRGEVC